MSSPSWHTQAACRGLDPELFFPERGTQAGEAKAVCRGCPVVAECYEAGKDEEFGIWGGTSRKERQMAEKGHTSGRVKVRGCYLCGMPADYPARYCSDDCRARARKATR
ncbi:MAG TPA: WhiB family transcriptional regulator, partial [Acidimicrobiia bacterium]|nr:WhiB family transcriptional regulator [Acidimicrobiia bacterium]